MSNLTLYGGHIVSNGAPVVGVVQIDKGVTTSLTGMTISGGNFGLGALLAGGGGIANHGLLAINQCTIEDNAVEGTNSQDGGIFNDGTVSITASTVSYNSCLSGGEGGGIYNSGQLTLTDSTLQGNLVVGSGGGLFNSGGATISGSTIYGNSSSVRGGGILNGGSLTATDTTIAENTGLNTYTLPSYGFNAGSYGGGVLNDGAMTLVDCTVAGNNAFEGAGLFDESGSLSLINCTVAFNTASVAGSPSGPIAGSGAGIYVYAFLGPTPVGLTPATPVVLQNTIVAENMCSGIPGLSDQNLTTAPGASFSTSSSYNLIGPGNIGNGLLQNGVKRNQVGVANPGLAGLGSFGGPTQTVGLEYGSPAINAGSNALVSEQTFDGRGAGNPRVVGGTVDIGADEFTAQSAPIVSRFVVLWGSSDGADLTSDRNGNLLPQGRTNDIPWLGINRFYVNFSQLLVLSSVDIRVQSARGIAYGPVTVNGISNVYTITLARQIDADRVKVTIDIPGGTPFSGTLNVLPGDVNGDGVVNSKDLAAIHKDPNAYQGALSVLYQDITGNGKVGGGDYNAVKHRLGAVLPRPLVNAKRRGAAVGRARSHSTV